MTEPTVWNAPDENGRACLARDCNDVLAVRPTGYHEVAELLGTSGCSSTYPYWSWEVLGVLNTPRGRVVICPGDTLQKTPDGWHVTAAYSLP